MQHVRILAADEYQGRRTGEAGNEKAAQYILNRFQSYGLDSLDGGYKQPFQFYSRFLKKVYAGNNIWGMVKGQLHPDTFLVVSAHYDHVGVRAGEIYNGADDNASGVGALLELARYFAKAPTSYSLLFVAFDAEELGLKGAAHFVDSPPVPLGNIKLNINMDMVGRNADAEIFICGTAHYPQLRPVLQPLSESQERIRVSFGHDQAGEKHSDDWTKASDHGCFHEAGIPFLYFGVEDHEDYHQPTDDAERIMPLFYQNVVELVLAAIQAFQLTP
ncbi:MAG TPA: M28 family peptidase [Phaeodactylibacter sp.]|nr:M28 family peptidase [Phaeodactylibacter sp.]